MQPELPDASHRAEEAASGSPLYLLQLYCLVAGPFEDSQQKQQQEMRYRPVPESEAKNNR